jgi:concanavalin A-like lectin/glucanase superfamily protein
MYVHSRFLLSLILAFVLNPWVPPAMSSPIPAVSFPESSIRGTLSGANFTLGWQFSLSHPVQVTSLGIHDYNGNGLVNSHPIGLWTDTGTLLTSATVAPSAPLESDFFRYTAIPSLILTPGTYVIAAFYETSFDPTVANIQDFTTAPGITFQGNESAEGASLTFPTSTNNGADPAYFGPNFKFEAVAQPCVQPPAGLVSWWSGDGNAQDIVGSNNGMLQNGATFADGKVGQAFSFNGVNAFVSGDTTTGFPLGSSSRTITAWIKAASSGPRDSLIFHYGVGNGAFPPTNFHLLMSGEGRAAVGNGFGYGLAVGTTFLGDGQFHFLAGIYEGPATNIARIYVDGMEEGSAVIVTPGTLAGGFKIGQELPAANQLPFHGLIDEVDLYNRALSAAEIQAIFHAGSAGKCKARAVVQNPDNGHFYEFVPGYLTWPQARDAAASRSYQDLRGYLVTITSQSEQTFIEQFLESVSLPPPPSGDFPQIWMGGSDAAQEGVWTWVTGPEAGIQFWQGNFTGSPVGGAYANWETFGGVRRQPDNAGEEHFLSIEVNATPGAFPSDERYQWNDSSAERIGVGYIVEYSLPLPVNDHVSFVADPTTFATTSDTTGCPVDFVGKFSFTARLTAKPGSPSLTDLRVQVQTLTNGNLLQNADGGPGGVGAILTVPQADAFADGILSPEESVDVPFVVCLQQLSPFRFFVDVLGERQ